MRISAALLLLGLASEGWTEQTIDDNEIWSKGHTDNISSNPNSTILICPYDIGNSLYDHRLVDNFDWRFVRMSRKRIV